MSSLRWVGIGLATWSLSACASLPQLAVTHDTLSASEHVTLGNTYWANGEKKLAVQQFQAALDKDRHCVPALVALGNDAFEEHKWGPARSYFRHALKSAPNDAAVRNNLAMVDLAEGKHLDQARRLVEEVLPTAGARAPYLWDTLANIALRQGRYADAKSALDHASATAPVNNPEFQTHLQESRQRLADATKSPH